MPVERDLSKILALPDDDLFRWRADTRRRLAGCADAQLSALYEATLEEVVRRAARAWASVDRRNGPGQGL